MRPETLPLWGQTGELIVTVGAMRVRIELQGMFGIGSTFCLFPGIEILYIGDFDPSGMHMSEMDLPERIKRYGGVVDITRVAARRDNCGRRLPGFSVETKKGDPRYKWFKENHGRTCWELDAMNPNDLRARLRSEIMARLDIEAWSHCKKVEDAEKESLNSYIKAWPRV
ncbi:MAG: hypothetical protein USCAAHI_01823 [Beijerinckiaceae bacterium]|nr:MAG: hypothetical protein USCAAHI_01823 [Beijerinckiaceae bacterium]